MIGSKYAVAMAQLENNGALHMYAHMLFIKIQEENLDVITDIMTQISLKAGLKQLATKIHNYVHSNMSQVHFRDTFKPMNWKELDDAQRKIVLESHMFLNKNIDGKLRKTTSQSEKPAHQIQKHDPCY